MSDYGTLFGVGVGPGAPDLMTLRAAKILREAPVLGIPRVNQYSKSLAWRIAEPVIGEIEGQERIFLTFPMTRDPEILRPAWEIVYQQLGEHLEQGRDVAFLTQGDPFVYSSFIYLYNEAPRRWPGIDIEVVPAVSSITAVPVITGIPLADGQERIAVLPSMYDVSDLEQILDTFDTIVLMKVRAVIGEVTRLLERKGLLDKAIYVSKATTENQRIIHDLRTLDTDRCDYFSMVVIGKKDRSGVLVGEDK